MHDTGTVFRTDIVVGNHNASLLVLLLRFFLCTGVKRLIAKSYKVLTLTGLQNGVGFFALFRKAGKYSVKTCYGKDIEIPVRSLDLRIVQVRMHTKCHIGGKCPRRSCPGKEIALFTLYFKTHHSGALCKLLIALRYLMGGKRGSATGTVGHNLKALIQELSLPNLL